MRRRAVCVCVCLILLPRPLNCRVVPATLCPYQSCHLCSPYGPFSAHLRPSRVSPRSSYLLLSCLSPVLVLWFSLPYPSLSVHCGCLCLSTFRRVLVGIFRQRARFECFVHANDGIYPWRWLQVFTPTPPPDNPLKESAILSVSLKVRPHRISRVVMSSRVRRDRR